MFVYDITMRDTFDNLTKWLMQAKESVDEMTQFFLIGESQTKNVSSQKG